MQFLVRAKNGREVTRWKSCHVEVNVVHHDEPPLGRYTSISLRYGSGDWYSVLNARPELVGFVVSDLLKILNRYCSDSMGRKKLKLVSHSVRSAYDVSNHDWVDRNTLIDSHKWEHRQKFFPKIIPLLKE